MSRKKRKGTGPPVRLPVSDGSTTLVDSDVAEKLAGRALYAHPQGYVQIVDGGRLGLLHRLLCGAFPGQVVDHRNGDKRDNRAANLRVGTQASNARGAYRPYGRYPWRGVAAQRNRCRARLRTRADERYCGDFRSPLVAAFARDDAAHRRRWPCEGNNFPRVIMRRDLRGFLHATNGKLFSVTFVRRGDGAVRRMLCRTGVKRHGGLRIDDCGLAATPATESNPQSETRNPQSVEVAQRPSPGLRFDPSERNLFSVYDVQKRQYRFIPLENVLCVTCNRERYRVLTHAFTIAA